MCVCARNEDNAVSTGNRSKDISYFHAALPILFAFNDIEVMFSLKLLDFRGDSQDQQTQTLFP